MMLVVGGVTVGTLFATQRRVQAAYEQIFDLQFQNQINYFARLQEARLAVVKEASLGFVKNVRVRAALEEYAAESDEETATILYKNARDEIFRPGTGLTPRTAGLFFRLLDSNGKVIPVSGGPKRSVRDPRRGPLRLSATELDTQLELLEKALAGQHEQQVGYLVDTGGNDAVPLREVVLTKVASIDTGKLIGALVIGFALPEQGDRALKEVSSITSGIALDGEVYSRSMPGEVQKTISQRFDQNIGQNKQGRFVSIIQGKEKTVFFRALNEDSDFPPAYQVSVYSMDEAANAQKQIRAQVLGLGAGGMIVALLLSMFLSKSLTGPLHELSRGTKEVEAGNLTVRVPVRTRDEIGELAQSFNQMTEGLALKEKYRSVLDMVADKKIAQDLMSGKIELGGEEREIAVLFCDIRGFTALTQNMEPREVFAMLNEHFTPLTRVVYENHGVVDKFVGDMIMAVFGAPTSAGNDALLAARCALRMVEERQKLNETSKYKISMGIGVASGKANAGRMGSEDRLSYTVLGARVNLGARLCSQAGRNEVVIDQITYEACKDLAEVEPLPELRLKGFSEPVHAFKLKSLRAP